jgi:hypothetical protein
MFTDVRLFSFFNLSVIVCDSSLSTVMRNASLTTSGELLPASNHTKATAEVSNNETRLCIISDGANQSARNAMPKERIMEGVKAIRDSFRHTYPVGHSCHKGLGKATFVVNTRRWVVKLSQWEGGGTFYAQGTGRFYSPEALVSRKGVTLSWKVNRGGGGSPERQGCNQW